MAGTIKVDQVQSDSNLAFAIAGSNVAFMNATSLQMVGSNVSLAGTNVITNGKVLATAMHPGAVLQVVSTTKTDTFSTSSYNTWVDVTGLSVSITPTSASSKILILADVVYGGTSRSTGLTLRCLRGSTAIGVGDTAGNRIQAFAGTEEIGSDGIYGAFGGPFNYLDSPATTSSTTYKIQLNLNDNYGAAVINRTGYDGDTVAFSRHISTITVMEISA